MASPSSIRCDWRGIARSPEQRERAIRFWLGIEPDAQVPSPSYVETLFTVTLNTLNPVFRETAKSNLLAIARGGLSTEYMFLTCYVDYIVSEYLLGAGPSTLTVAYDRMDEAYAYDLYRLEHADGSFGPATSTPMMSEGEYHAELDSEVWAAESSLAAMIGDRESIVFLAPMGAHNAIAVEAWQVVAQWDLQTDDQGTMNAVRYGAPQGDPEYTQTLANLKSRITAATTATTTPTRIQNVSGLTQYYRDIGAYGDITPDDGDTTPFTPAQRPPVPTCEGVSAVTGPRLNPGLVRDCSILLDSMDTLAGTAALDWTATSAISTWEGIDLNASSTRVTLLDLDDEDLDGTIPPALGGLSDLVTLDLSDNDLTGEIPQELGRLLNLETLRLSGNSFTGCIPLALKSVTTNDLASLNLLYCRPPTPQNLRAGTTTETSVALSWDAVPNVIRYRVEYLGATATEWTVDDDMISGTTHTVNDLTCGGDFRFRVSAYDSGTTYAAEWSRPSDTATATMGECRGPEFSLSSYDFSVSEDTSIGQSVGTVSATDPDEADTVTYSITAGNELGDFAIDALTGRITAADHLDYETVSSYTLTVEASDDSGNTATAAVEIDVTDVQNELSPSPKNFSVSLIDGGFSMTWEAVAGAVRYAVQYRIPGVQDQLADLPFTESTSLEFIPAEGVRCETVYVFRAFSYGDGTAYLAAWGRPPLEVTSITTGACNSVPEFGESVYSFSIAEDAAASTAVGSVSATDPDEGDTVTYSITVGNTDGKFAIGESTGAITVAGALDHETIPSYSLTVEASDGNGGTATATVEISVTDVQNELSPSPKNFSVSLIDGGFSMTWEAVVGAVRYAVQYRIPGVQDQLADLPFTESTSLEFIPAEGVRCETIYVFRAFSYGDGTAYLAAWGRPPLEVTSVTTGPCNQAPEFVSSTYSFSIAEDATTAALVGTVSATDADSDTVTYSITDGNSDGKFSIDDSTGEVTVAGALDYETTASYTLTVEASDGRGGTDTATVEVTVTDVAEDRPPAPEGLSVSLADDAFSITWTTLTGAARYEPQYRIGGPDEEWASMDTVEGTSSSFSPDGGPACGSTYEFRVRAYGDGTTYAAVWGRESDPATVTTGACNSAPEFGASSYSFSIAENAATSTTVGMVSATDPNEGDTVSYTITGGNGDGKFDIGASTGEITVAGVLDPEAVVFYVLTVKASDGSGGAASATVGISVILAECSNGTVVPRPNDNPGLVRDCSMLLAARDTLAGEGSLDWSADTPMSGWQGVTVEPTPSPYVRVLMLTGLGLTGKIPPALGGLADMRRLDLDENELTGEIPPELARLSSLDQLYLFDNQLSGGIPSELGNLSNLTIMYLHDNMLSGGIPLELTELNRLRKLTIDGNQLTGEIPSQMGDMDSLEELWVRDNLLTGGIPSELEKLSNLTYLYLEGNGFTGCIPSGLRDVDNNDLDLLGLEYCGSSGQ